MLHSQPWHLPSPRKPPYLQNTRINIQPCGRRAECPPWVHADSDWCQLDWRGDEDGGKPGASRLGAPSSATSKRGAKPPETEEGGGGRLASGPRSLKDPSKSEASDCCLQTCSCGSAQSLQSSANDAVLVKKGQIKIQWMKGKMKSFESSHTRLT